mgnify:CR=1 FL=1
MKNIVILLFLFLASGCTAPSLTSPSPEDKAQWEAHRQEAHGAAYNWLSRSHYGTQPWFVEGESLVYSERKLVALRYHAAFVFGSKNQERLKEYDMTRQATHVVEYNLKTKQWSLVYPEHKN